MLEIRFFQRKWRTHGLLTTLAYTGDYLFRPLFRALWLQPVRRYFPSAGKTSWSIESSEWPGWVSMSMSERTTRAGEQYEAFL